MNSLVTLFGLESWKPLLTVLVLPPIPFFLLLLIGARLILPRRGLGWFVILLSLAGLWLSSCLGVGHLLRDHVIKPPPPLGSEDIAALKAAVKAREQIAIVVLGGGAEQLAPEYGVSNLSATSLQRLRYGIWLSRETGAPLVYSGGLDWGHADGQPEAQIAARIASRDFSHPLKWAEDKSRDTRENAQRTIGQFRQDGVTRILLVTDGYHMPRARQVFEQTAGPGGIRITAAPMGLAKQVDAGMLTWLPTPAGFSSVNRALREMLALAARA